MAPDDYFRVIFGLIVVIGLIGVAAMIARKAGVASLPNIGTRRRRLAISESLSIDGRRRLMIVRCDGREHLILMGAQSETVIGDEFDATIVEPEEQPPHRNPFAELRAAFGVAREKQQDAA